MGKLNEILGNKVFQFQKALGRVCDAIVEINATIEKCEKKLKDCSLPEKRRYNEIVALLNASEQYKDSINWISGIVMDHKDYMAVLRDEKLPKRPLLTGKENIRYINENYHLGRKK